MNIPGKLKVLPLLQETVRPNDTTAQANQPNSSSATASPPVQLISSSAAMPTKTHTSMPVTQTSNTISLTFSVPKSTSLSTSSVLQLPKMGKAQEEHLNSLFGVLNPQTKDIMATTISTKIQKIANPIQTKSQQQTTAPLYKVREITEYTCASTPTVLTMASAMSTLSHNQPVYLLPVGPTVPSAGHSSVVRQPVMFVRNPVSGPGLSVTTQGPRPVTPSAGPGHITDIVSRPMLFLSSSNPQPQMPLQLTLSPVKAVSQTFTSPAVGGAAPVQMQLGQNSIQNQPQMPLQLTLSQVKPVSQTFTSPAVGGAAPVQMQLGQTSIQNLKSILTPVLKTTVSAVPVSPDGKASIIPNVKTAAKTLRPIQPQTEPKAIEENAKTEPTSKNLLFRVRPGQGFVCEACKKFTKDEMIFKKHLWEHFHAVPLACSSCNAQQIVKKEFQKCKLVSSIVNNLVANSLKSGKAPVPNNQKSKIDGDIIDITDDDNEGTKPAAEKNGSTAEVIVLDGEEDNNCLQIRICETFSLAKQNEKDSIEVKTEEEVKEPLNQNEHFSAEMEVDDSDEDYDGDKTAKGNTTASVDETDIPRKDCSVEDGEEMEVDKSCEKEAIQQKDNKDDDSDLLNKSLSQSEIETENTVAQVIDSKFKKLDPSHQENEMNIDKILEDAVIPISEQDKPISAPVLKATKVQVNKALAEFDEQLIEGHNGNAFYACGYENCGFVCLSSGKYREHLKDKCHQGEYCYLCCHCGQKDYAEDSHVRHLFSHALSKTFILYKCPLRQCKFKTNLMRFYDAHLKQHQENELSLKCTYCHQMLPSTDSLVQHLENNLLKIVSCPHCSFKFENKSVVFQHMVLSHPDKLRIVSVSCQVLCNEREINFHVVPKSKIKPFSENEPKQQKNTSEDTDTLDISKLLDEVNKAEERCTEGRTDDNDSESGDQCDGRETPELPDLDLTEPVVSLQKVNTKEKKLIIKDKDSPKDSAGPKDLLCKICKYLSYNQTYFIQHQSLHDGEPEREKRFLCPLCPKGHDTLPYLKKHMVNHLGSHEIKVYGCTACTYQSNVKSHIMDHCEDGHTPRSFYTLKEEKVQCTQYYQCKYCDFKARMIEHVNQHETIVHKIKSGKSKAAETWPEDEPIISPNKTSENNQAKMDKDGGKKKYHCEYCRTYWKHKVDLKQHLVTGHNDIENKQFTSYKCKFCTFTSTMKQLIMKHIEKDHPGKPLRILRKTEYIDDPQQQKESPQKSPKVQQSADIEKQDEAEPVIDAVKTEVVIPDGNTFKVPFRCPECTFMSNYRISTMRHLKEHPHLKPVRPGQTGQDKSSPPKHTARKSTTTTKKPILKLPSMGSLLHSNTKGSVLQHNPFTKVKEAVAGTSKDEASSPSKDYYILGEGRLHSALSACFLPMDKDLRFQCRICNQKIAKKFVLHRHILDHLKIVFFRCHYCDEGTIERTLIAGHLQKEHSHLPLVYDTVSKTELEHLFKNRIFEQTFDDQVRLEQTVDNVSQKPNDLGLKTTQVHEIQDVKSADDQQVAKERDTSVAKETSGVLKKGLKKCPLCRYTARENYIKRHLIHHQNPDKKFLCSECDYRGDKIDVIKHMYRVAHRVQPKVVEAPAVDKQNEGEHSEGQEDNKQQIAKQLKQEKHSKKKDDSSSVNSEGSDKFVTNNEGKTKSVDAFTVSSKGVFEIKTKYKCKICGEVKGNSRSLYTHFSMSPRCGVSFYKCSLCSFQSTKQGDIHKHSQIRHANQKITIVRLPANSKIRVFKTPIKQTNQVANMLRKQLDTQDIKSTTDSDSDREVDGGEKSPVDSQQLTCKLCQKFRCANVMKLQYHVNTMHQGTTVYCTECSYKSPVLQHMLNHCKTVHLQSDPSYCDKSFSSVKSSVKEEKSSLTPKTPRKTIDKSVLADSGELVCPKCDLKMASATTLKIHLYKHFNYRPYSCPFCKHTFDRRDRCHRHMEDEHPNKTSTINVVRNEEMENKLSRVVSKAMNSKKSKEVKSHQGLDSEEAIDKVIRHHKGVWICKICNSRYDTRRGLNWHLRIQSQSEKRGPDVKQNAEEGLKAKQRKLAEEIHESGKSETIESEYQQTFSRALYRIVRTSKGEKVFKCVFCQYSTSSKPSFRLHFDRLHRKMYGCCYCGQKSSEV